MVVNPSIFWLNSQYVLECVVHGQESQHACRHYNVEKEKNVTPWFLFLKWLLHCRCPGLLGLWRLHFFSALIMKIAINCEHFVQSSWNLTQIKIILNCKCLIWTWLISSVKFHAWEKKKSSLYMIKIQWFFIWLAQNFHLQYKMWI